MAEKTIQSDFYKPQDQQPAFGLGEKYLELRYDPTTGDTRLLEYNTTLGAVGVKQEVYKNGVWARIPGAVTSVAEKEKVNDLVKTKINLLKGDPKNIIPAFVLQNAPSQDVGDSGAPVPSANSAGLSGIIGQVLGGDLGITPEEYASSNMSELFKKIGPLKYPLDLINKQQDILKISQYTYTAPYGDVFKGKQTSDILKVGAQRQSALKEFIQSLILPIPNNVVDSNTVNWGNGDEMSAMNMAAVSKIGKVAGAVGITNLAGLLASAAGKTSLADLSKSDAASKAAGQFAAGALDNPSTGAAIQSLILKKAGFDISPETILSRGYGVVANSNLELLFSGPILRGFQFSYVFSPRSEKEAKMCRNIIRYFKQGMAAKKKNSTGYGAASFFLATPNVFKLEYITTDSKGARTSIEGLNKFKICALTGMNVSYADGQWSAYEKGQPVRMQLSLNFKELEPVYESDYQETQSSGFKINDAGNDQEPVFPDDVGF